MLTMKERIYKGIGYAWFLYWVVAYMVGYYLDDAINNPLQAMVLGTFAIVSVTYIVRDVIIDVYDIIEMKKNK